MQFKISKELIDILVVEMYVFNVFQYDWNARGC